jgi:hypothetical protein
MKAEVDTHTREGERLPQGAATRSTVQETGIFDALGAAADARVAEIVGKNGGHPAKGAGGHGER